MLHTLLPITLAMLASPAKDALPSAKPWAIIAKADMSAGRMLYDEIGNSWNVGGHLIWGQVYLTDDEVSIDIAARGCVDRATDYRQKITFPRTNKETEIAALRASTLKLVGVIQEQCSLSGSTTDAFMNGLEPAYRDLYDKNRSARPEAQ
ncbi:hypothetical protein [Sphingobium sp.]|uniref:hypothetical protein n=1 Tax=Sphingobium sp. TaxID=1912891 RepID=UPI00260A7FCA|nr:hypothetical protein [Sphingobium sp.]